MAKFPKRGKAKPKAAALRWNSFTKAELIRTVKTLHTRQTKLLNRIAKLEQEREGALAAVAQDAVNNAMEVRQPLATLCDEFTRYNADDVREQHGAVTDRLPNATTIAALQDAESGGGEVVADLDGVLEAAAESELEELYANSRPMFPWEKK